MTSEEARELFSDSIEGTLDPARQRALEAALDADPELRTEWEAFRLAMRGASGIAEEPTGSVAAPDLLGGVQSRLRKRSRGRFYRDRFSEQSGNRYSVTVLAGAIVLMLCFIAAWIVLQSWVEIGN